MGLKSDDDLAYFNALDFLAKAQLVQNRMGSSLKLGEVCLCACAFACACVRFLRES